ncbi:MAG: hypothetical protein IPJ39_20660 [Saprospiraceae bacterium]|nr:hypothetical protein [Saprospiraceae bacterium]
MKLTDGLHGHYTVGNLAAEVNPSPVTLAAPSVSAYSRLLVLMQITAYSEVGHLQIILQCLNLGQAINFTLPA